MCFYFPYYLEDWRCEMTNHFSTDDPDFYKKRSSKLRQRDYSLEICSWDFSEPTSALIRWHWHEEIELVYVQSGQVYITCNQDNILADEGDIVFINQNTKHFITPAEDNNCVIKSIIVNPQFIAGYGHLDTEKKYITPVIHSATCRYILISKNHSNYDVYEHNVKNLLQLNSAKRIGYELLSQSHLLIIWKYLYDHISAMDVSETVSTSKTVQDEQRVKQAILYIQEHFTEPVSLDDIAGSILVSKSECCRCFKRAMNMTPFEYLMKYRIMESTKRMRRKNHETISEIAGAVGFNNTSYYNKIFKKYMGCTPTEYRSTVKTNIPSAL